MKKENVIDFNMYLEQCDVPDDKISLTMSEELQTAIQNLIHRLRELGPIQ